MSKFKLGNTLRDRVTGVQGITTGKIEYLNGCVQWNIHPKADKDGKPVESFYYDEQQLELVDEGIASQNSGKRETSKPSVGGAPSSVKTMM